MILLICLLCWVIGALVLRQARIMNRYNDVVLLPGLALGLFILSALIGTGPDLLGMGIFFAGTLVWAVWFAHTAPKPRPDLETPAPDGVVPPEGYRTHTLNALHLLVFKTIPRKDLDEPLLPGVTKHSDITFGRAGSRPLLLNLYEGARTGTARPAILFVHGGSWKTGDKDQLHIYANHFATLGYVTICMEYRLMDEAAFPAALEDVLTAIRWTRANAAKFEIDPARIGISGNSAGGHLAMMAAFAGNDPQWDRSSGYAGEDESVAALVNIYGGYDLTADWVRHEDNIQNFLKARPGELEKYQRASPAFHLTPHAPPTLSLHGTLDLHAPVTQSDQLNEDLERLGIPRAYGRLEGWAHIFDATQAGFAWACGWMEPFFEKHLRGE